MDRHETEVERVGRGRAGPDGAGFAALAEAHRGELLVHCYRMTGSLADAEELVQETFLRAWRHRERFEGRASMRTWLYRIATNACLDWLEQAARRVTPAGLAGASTAAGSAVDSTPWLQPIPDGVLDQATNPAAGPEAQAVAREAIELSLLAALQLLPPRQRAAFIARDVVGWPASEVAVLLDTTSEAVNSLVQRARTTMQANHDLALGGGLRAPTTGERELLARYVAAHERGDVAGIEALMSADVVVTMPPEPLIRGSVAAGEAFGPLVDPAITGEWRLVPVAANRQPATANYLRRPGDATFRATSIDVLRVVDARLVEINCFLGAALFDRFGLPLVHEPGRRPPTPNP